MAAARVPNPFQGVLAAAIPGCLDPARLAVILADPDHALPTPPATQRSSWDMQAGGIDSASARAILARATADLGAPWPVPLASTAVRVHRDGDRESWESVAFARQWRLSRAVVAAAVDGGDSWIDEVADGVQLLCEQSSWCWPAHDDTFARHASVVPTVTDPFIDLGAGEVVDQLAWLDHTLGAELDLRYPGMRTRIRHEARTRIFEPFVARRDWHWIGLDGDVHNWNPWIHGNILTAALRLLDSDADSAWRAEIVALCIEGLDRYLSALPTDGAIDEGYGYWWNGACRALEALEVLCHATHGATAAAFAIPAVRNTVAFPHQMHLSGPWFVNCADAQARDDSAQPWHSLYRAARRIGDPHAAAFATAHVGESLTEIAGLGRLLQGLTDRAWHGEIAGSSPLPRDMWLESVQVLVSRETAGTAKGLTLVAKGGNNAEHHNHNDVGSFIVASDGVPVVVDAGRPTYTAATFGPNRYKIWTMQSSWHNVPVMFGVAQNAEATAAATLLRAEFTDVFSCLVVDIAAAYPIDQLDQLVRTATLHRDTHRVAVSDRWTVRGEKPDGETSIRLLVAGSLEMGDGYARVVPVDVARPVTIRWPAACAARVVRRELDDRLLRDVWGAELHRIDILPGGADRVTVTIDQDPPTGRGA